MKMVFTSSNLLPLLQTFFFISPTFSLTAPTNSTTCKSTPNDVSWPSIAQWTSLNQTLSGRLLHPLPPASACHSSFPGSSNESCAEVTAVWSDFTFHQDNPISVAWNNMNNDSCLPDPTAPCSGLGYPVYVVNASSANDIKLAVDFARNNSIRLNVKASGHDYLKRSTAPYSLSIWTRYMVGGYKYHDTFQPQSCNITINTTAVTAGAGSYVSDIYENLSLHNLTIVDGMGAEVTMGGYLTGGGHSPLSHMHGLGSDQVYEVEMVTPGGEIIIANECQNADLFWAVRGGGGGTFGVLTKVTIRALPTTPIATYNFILQTSQNSTVYWDAISYIISQFPSLATSNISAFTYLYPFLQSANSTVSEFQAVFALPNPSSSTELADLWAPIWEHLNATYPGQITTSASSQTFNDLYSLYLKYADLSTAGVDKVVGSWLLPAETLTDDALRPALVQFLGQDGGRLYMVSGKGVWDAVPRGGSDAVNPAWRKALVHAVTSSNWTPGNATQRATVEYNINHVRTEALRKLVPESGAYVNEAYWDESDFQRAFWGSNYGRLLQIKKTVDPEDVFWCQICVGSEGWEMVEDTLCRA